MMQRRVIYLFFLYAVSCAVAIAQQTNIQEFNLNKNEAGSTYKFSFVHISDIHIGEGFSDYGTTGYYNDTMPTIDTSKPTKRLQYAIEWINANAVAKNIKFVVISGDLTGSAEKSEFEKCKQLLDELQVPYVPIIGNHDIWSYVRYQDEAPYANADSVWNEVFESTYQFNSSFFTNWNNGTRLQRTYNPETGIEHYFQNFSFEYDDFLFYGLDFNPRYHVNKAEPGIGPEAQLMDWNGGTFRWLKNELAINPNKKNKNVLFISHHPATDNLLFILSGFVFDFEEYGKLINMLMPYKQNLSLWLTGHIHIDYDYWLTNSVMQVRGMAANKDSDSAHLEIIHVYEVPTTTDIETKKQKQTFTIFPNPSNGKIMISTAGTPFKTSLNVYDMVGNKVYASNIHLSTSNEIDISFLPKGTYLIQFINQEDSKTIPITIQ